MSHVKDTISDHVQDEIVEAVKHGKKFRLVGDNVNFTVDVSHLRQSEGKKKHMEHWFGSAAIIQEINFSNLSPVSPQRILTTMTVQDWEGLRNDYTILIMRVLVKHLPVFSSLNAMVPSVINGQEAERLKTINKVIPLPVLPKNEQTYSDVVDILDQYESLVKEVFVKAGVPLNNSTLVHIGGDQLTRERFSGAKRLRGTAAVLPDRCLHLSPITFELFHLQMTVLTMMYKLLYNSKRTESGTLGAEKVRLGRKRADGDDVKCHFEDCSELAVSVTDAYIVEAACHYLGMEDANSTPTHHTTEDIQSMSDDEKFSYLKSSVQQIVDTMILSRSRHHIEHELMESGFQCIQIKCPDGSILVLRVPIHDTQQSTSTSSDDNYSIYAGNMLEIGLLFKDLSDAIRCPDRTRMLRIMKYRMLMLKGYNNRSKYALEIFRFICHQLPTLSPQAAHESFYGLFVNKGGKYNSHIAADMQMEHVVRMTKDHIRALHSNKSEKTIVKRTGSIAGMSAISSNFDEETCVVQRAQKHKVPTSVEDEKLVIRNLRRLRPFHHQAGRNVASVSNIAQSPVCKLKKKELISWMRTHQVRLCNELGN